MDRPSIEGAIELTAFYNRMYGSGHLGGDCCRRPAAQIGDVVILGDVPFELFAEAVGKLQNGDLCCHP